jgi:hypothetical protein
MKRKGLLALLLVLGLAGWFGYREYHRGAEDLKGLSPDHRVTAAALLAAFEQDTASASKQYVDRVVEVEGRVKSIDGAENPVVISLGESGTLSSVQCSMDSSHAADYQGIREGDAVRLQGICFGADVQELFGTDVKLKRCVVVEAAAEQKK